MDTQSDSIGELAKAIVSVQKGMEAAPASSENPFFKSHYADLNTCWEAVRGLLAASNLALIQTFGGTAEAPSVITTLAHGPSGEWIKSELVIAPEKKTPQGVGSALTYGRRYSFAILGLTTAPDDDAEGAMNRKKKQAPKDDSRAGVDDIPLGGGYDKPEDLSELTDEERKARGLISKAQRVRLSTIATKQGWSVEQVKELLKKKGFDSSHAIKWQEYKGIVEQIESLDLSQK